MNNGMLTELATPQQLNLRVELRRELDAILHWWSSVAVDPAGGFYGAVNNNDEPDLTAPKGSVMMARICWTFSEAVRFYPLSEWEQMSTRAFDYLVQHFWDHQHGGTYWSVKATGELLDGRKQIYGQAFCLYAFAAYYRIVDNGLALNLAKDLFEYIERYSRDKEHGGYVEAFAQDWSPIEDLRLSSKDDNFSKTANTHLHIIEAYAQLYRVSPSEKLKKCISELLDLFDRHFITDKGELLLFFDDNWENKTRLRSFGHEIEAAWLLLDCAEVINDPVRISCFKQHCLRLTLAALQAMDSDGGLWYEWFPAENKWIKEKHSWPQAEAMMAFTVLWQQTGNNEWLQKAIESWTFIKKYISDHKSGEWYWGVDEHYNIMDKDKGGFWKCPYHNSRSILETMYKLSNQVELP